MALASALNIVAGVWLAMAPWVLGYVGHDSRLNDVFFGAVVASLAAVRSVGAHRESGLSWLNALIGVWLIVAAFAIDSSKLAAADDLIVGGFILVAATWSASASAAARDQP